MKRFLLFLVLLAACVLAVGYYREWFKFSMTSGDQSTNINMTVDKDKLKEDEEKAKENLGKLGGKIRDQAGELTKKHPKGEDSKAPEDKPQ
jgi:hypothetical protein